MATYEFVGTFSNRRDNTIKIMSRLEQSNRQTHGLTLPSETQLRTDEEVVRFPGVKLIATKSNGGARQNQWFLPTVYKPLVSNDPISQNTEHKIVVILIKKALIDLLELRL